MSLTKTLQWGLSFPSYNLLPIGRGDPITLQSSETDSKDKKVNIALSNSFGFGGTNASLVVGKVRWNQIS